MRLLPPSPGALSRSHVRFSGVRFSLAFPSGAPDNGLVFALSDFSLKSSQVPPKTGELSFPGRFLVHFDFQVPSGSRTHSKREWRPRQNRPPPPSPCYGLSAFLSPCEGGVDTGPQRAIQSRTGPPGSSLTPNPKALSHGQAEWLVWTSPQVGLAPGHAPPRQLRSRVSRRLSSPFQRPVECPSSYCTSLHLSTPPPPCPTFKNENI